MRYVDIKGTDMKVSRLAVGCMRIAEMTVAEVEAFIQKALDLGLNFFDHADIYGGGRCEAVFGEALARHPQWREQMFIQDKCGIVPGMGYDLSCDHIIQSVNQSLERLQTDYLDVLLLHRPDVLMDPSEIAQAFDILYASGKVRFFGVSNMNPMQIRLIKKFCNQPIVINQLQYNVVNSGMIDCGINVNMKNNEAINRDGSVLEYCYLHDITIQPWSILQASWEEGTYLDNPDYKELNDALETIGKKYGLDKAGCALSWILAHPSRMQPICGTTNLNHLEALAKACDVKMKREDFYALYKASGKTLP